VRLADVLFRRGHLSDRALSAVCMTGERPAHLDRCDPCAERAVQLGRWLEDVRGVGTQDADAAFSAERLAVQHAQILRRLEQIEQPARVISFPAQVRAGQPGPMGRKIGPVWVGLAAAAGLALGVVGGQMTARFNHPDPAVQDAAVAAAADAPSREAATRVAAVDGSLVDVHLDRPQLPFLDAMDQLTPRSDSVLLVSLKGGK
jgi:hypothetical protein